MNAKILEMLNTAAVSDQLGGMQLMQELTRVESEENASKVTNFANYLRQPIASSDPHVSALAARCLGQLACAEGGHAAVTPALKQALGRLRDGKRLDAAVLVLCQLAEHAPTLTYGAHSGLLSRPPASLNAPPSLAIVPPVDVVHRRAVHLTEIFEHLWTAMRDARMKTRLGAAETLRACLSLIATRQGTSRRKWYLGIDHEARKGAQANIRGRGGTSPHEPARARSSAHTTCDEAPLARDGWSDAGRACCCCCVCARPGAARSLRQRAVHRERPRLVAHRGRTARCDRGLL